MPSLEESSQRIVTDWLRVPWLVDHADARTRLIRLGSARRAGIHSTGAMSRRSLRCGLPSTRAISCAAATFWSASASAAFTSAAFSAATSASIAASRAAPSWAICAAFTATTSRVAHFALGVRHPTFRIACMGRGGCGPFFGNALCLSSKHHLVLQNALALAKLPQKLDFTSDALSGSRR